MRKQNSNFETRFISEEGSRLENNDYFGYVELDDFACYVIADGINETSDVGAARLAIETIILDFQAAPSMSKHGVKKLLRKANKVLLGKDSYQQMKVSLMLVITDYQKLRYGYAGNTRFRLYRGGNVYKKSRDMSLSQNMAEEDKIPTDEVMRHEERNNLYSYLGKKSFQSYVSRKIKLLETDMIALYTRGIWENVEEAELDDVFAQADNEVQNTVDNIEDLLLSRTPEHIDNYTLAVIFINKVYQNPRKAKWRKRAIQISIVLVVLIGGVCITMWILLRRKQQNITDMNYHFTNTIEYINTGNYIRAKEECTAAQELAEKLKDTVMRERLQEYLFVIEAVILGDESYSSKDYDSANEQYMRAMDRARYADHIGADYIEGKLDKISEILSVEIAIQLGDELLEQGDYEGAEIKYLLAKDIALAIRDSEGKQNAIEALEKLYEKKAEAESKQKEEAEAQAKEEVSAAQMLAEGDRAALEEDYVSAKVYYTMAAAKYEELKDNESKELVQEKLAAIEEKLTEQEKLAAEREELKKQAMAYENQGSACRQSGDLWGAKSNYLSAKSIYQQLEDNEAVGRIEEILGDIDLQIILMANQDQQQEG